MATPIPMDVTPATNTTDLEIKVAKLADPNTESRLKHAIVGDIRESLDTTRDPDSLRGLSYLVPTVLQLLVSVEPSFHKDSPEYQFRRGLMDIVSKLPTCEIVKGHAPAIFNTMLQVLRNDNEDNGGSACKIIVEVIRNYRITSEERFNEFINISQETFQNSKPLVQELLAEDSPLVDPTAVLRATKSFKVAGEMGMVLVLITQAHLQQYQPLHKKLPEYSSAEGIAKAAHAFEFLALESPVQHAARTNFEAMGGIWAGAAPGIKNTAVYADFIHAQIKILSYLAYLMRCVKDANDFTYGDTLMTTSIRLFQDCPSNGLVLRKELNVVFRHLTGTTHRRVLYPQVEKLFDERVLLGDAVASKEIIRPIVYTAVGDLFHQIKGEMTASQLESLVQVYLSHLHSPTISFSMLTLFVKVVDGLPEVILQKETSQQASRLFRIIFEAFLEKLEGIAVVQSDVSAIIEQSKDKMEEDVPRLDSFALEKLRPLPNSVGMAEKAEETLPECRALFRAVLYGLRACAMSLKKCETPIDDGALVFRFFEASIRCMALFDADPRNTEQTDPIEWFSAALSEVNLHVFQEVWTQKMDFFFQHAQKRILLLNVCQFLFARESTSPTLLAIVLHYLLNRLPQLGEDDDHTAAATIRLYKIAFSAVGAFPATNEGILSFHVPKLLMDCFPLAAKAARPSNYFHLLRALFRAIGSGGGRYELLYTAVLPYLPELLENLNRQLHASDGPIKDMIVELCLTVPLRLTHLLPHLTYLMQPLALALRGNTDLVSQGLRTLELCIDNLTPDFLDPTLSTVLRELMEALFSHLKPLPSPHHPAHTTIRILGKLGGRNRRLLTKEPSLSYHHHSPPAMITLSFSGHQERILVSSISKLAAQTVTKSSTHDRAHAYDHLENCIAVLLYEGVKGRNAEETFTQTVEGIFDALHIPELEEKAEAFIRKLGRIVLGQEVRKHKGREQGQRPVPSVFLSCYLDAFPHALARQQPEHAAKAQSVISAIIQDFVTANRQPNNPFPHEALFILHQIANRFTSLCLEDSWIRKAAGCSAIKIMAHTPELGQRWITEREVDLMRTLLHILKDLPFDVPRNVEEVMTTLLDLLRIANSSLDFQGEGAAAARNKIVHLAGIFSPELGSPNALVREATQKCIKLLAEISQKTQTELMMPHRERLLGSIYSKPLRALPFARQIGMVEAVRYCVSLEPPLIEVGDELLRLLHEALALADAEDAQLLGQRTTRQNQAELVKLRVACIKLLTASMPLTDFFSRQQQTRQRVTGVYFKSLYSPFTEVKDVAHEGLRMVLTHQARLPKELLQTGLRPILMNLADPKRLSISGLEGLARLLELLTNYFKVEIGSKLLDHFRVVADPQLLAESSKKSLADSEGITKLVRLANIFHLLPAAANVFLDALVSLIVHTESRMCFSATSPFSEPLARYLDRYAAEGIDFFMKQISYPSFTQTLRNILRGNLAPNLLRELACRTPSLVRMLASSTEKNTTFSILDLFEDLSTLIPTWLNENAYVIEGLVGIWRNNIPPPNVPIDNVALHVRRYRVLLSIFQKALVQSPRIDLLFDLPLVYTLNLPMDTHALTKFLYDTAAFNSDVIYKRNILMRFLTWFADESYSPAHKAQFIRYVIIPVLLYQATQGGSTDALIDTVFVSQLQRAVWLTATEPSAFPGADDVFKIELLHLTTILVQHYSPLLEDVRKDIIQYAWFYVNGNDDVVVKQTAYLLSARFFAAFTTPSKFIFHAWTGLLRIPHTEGRNSIRQEALAVLAPSLSKSEEGETGYPQWATTTRRLLVEEGISSMVTIFHLIVKQQNLFFPVRSRFVPIIANSLSKLGLTPSGNVESRLLSIDILQVIFNWEEKAMQNAKSLASTPAQERPKDDSAWVTPLNYRENMVSYLVRLSTLPPEQPPRPSVLHKSLPLLQLIVGPSGWTDVTFGLRFFSRALESDIPTDNPAVLASIVSAAKVLNVIATERLDAWYSANALVLQKLIRKGLLSDELSLHEALLPIFDHLIRLYPLPKEDEEPQGEMAEFHSFLYSAIGEGLKNSTSLLGVLGMLKSIVQVTPERIEPFNAAMMKLLSKSTKDHIHLTPTSPGYDTNVRVVMTIMNICQLAVVYLADQRRWLLSALCAAVEKSKSVTLCRYILDLARSWALHKQEAYPTMKEKATLLQKMTQFENRGEIVFHPYLELIYDIYTDPSLRRSDLTNRLEQSFLLGCRAKDPVLREKFIDLLDISVPSSLNGRLMYVVGSQSWESLSDHNWIYLALHLLLGASSVDLNIVQDRRNPSVDITGIAKPTTRTLIRPMQRLLFLDPQVAHDTWVSLFPAVWASLNRRDQTEITHHMIVLLSRDYHTKQASLRPNIIQTLLTGIHACNPPMILPPHLVKYLAKTFGAWHIGLEILERSLESLKEDEITLSTYINDSLADVYAELAEEDLFYGLWRRRSIIAETNMGLAFEQAGMWECAAQTYETAQNRVRQGAIPFNETEFTLWEDHWILAAEKLQQWDILYEFAKGDGNQELMLECAWRTKDWSEQCESLEEQINQLPETPTPRRRVFEAFMALLKTPSALDKNVDFTRLLEDAMQLSLRKWVGLPSQLSTAHVPLLQHFQQFVELQEAVQIFGSLSQTNATNLEKKSSELKMVLQAWRERLPNLYDDINVWSDLVTWRQHVFTAINAAYMPLIGGQNAQNNNANTFGYRGYHETAWIINRFAHVARKHELLDVCFNSLTKIYTLPNIEISEAFLKLREQAKAHYQKPNELSTGLDVINNTNLMFFSTSQKAEFYTLKGMFYARLGQQDEASKAFGQAIQLDVGQGKAWAEYGRYSDRLFKENPADLSHASNAVTCYLHAAGLYKSGKCRPLLVRILWLLSLDSDAAVVVRAFDTYKGDGALWYWIGLIPQLTSSLQGRERKSARYLLMNLARHYPQAVFFHLRAAREELYNLRRSVQARIEAVRAEHARRTGQDPSNTADPATAAALVQATDAIGQAEQSLRLGTEYVDEILQHLKTSFPLLILSLETMVDQIQHKFKPPHEEDIYRTLHVLLYEALQHYMIKANSVDDDDYVPANVLANIQRVVTMMPAPIRKEVEDEIVAKKPKYHDYITKVQQMRDRFEALLDSRPRWQPLSNLSHYLTEFQYSKVDEIEVPGQYMEDKDSNQNFIRIQKFEPKYECYRLHGLCSKRITIQGSDNTKVSFLVQLPCSRQWRREEKLTQLLRTLNNALDNNKETRRRNLSFHYPAAVTCSPLLRLYQADSSYISFADIYDVHCSEMGLSREEPILWSLNKLKKILREQREKKPPQKPDYFSLRKEITDEVSAKMVPDDIIAKYFARSMEGPTELWRMRKQFAAQVATTGFATWSFFLSNRHPFRFLLSRSTGLMTMTDTTPGTATGSPIPSVAEITPFRFTPNMQTFAGPIFTEGIIANGLMALGRALTEPGVELEQQLCLFSRDELSAWFLIHKPARLTVNPEWREQHALHTAAIVERISGVSCKTEREAALASNGANINVPVVQTATNLISTATNPITLVKMGELFMPWF